MATRRIGACQQLGRHYRSEIGCSPRAEGRAAGVLNHRAHKGIRLDCLYSVRARLILMAPLRHDQHPLTEQTEELFARLWRAIADFEIGY